MPERDSGKEAGEKTLGAQLNTLMFWLYGGKGRGNVVGSHMCRSSIE